jgi:hypothetical protein
MEVICMEVMHEKEIQSFAFIVEEKKMRQK